MANSELACVYAALILADDGVEVTVSGGQGGRSLAWWRHHMLVGAAGSSSDQQQHVRHRLQQRGESRSAAREWSAAAAFAACIRTPDAARCCLPVPPARTLRLTTSPP